VINTLEPHVIYDTFLFTAFLFNLNKVYVFVNIIKV
jgi:hypothetical protein